MGLITKTKSWIDAENVLYTDLNDDFDTIYNEFNGNIDNNNIKPAAGIDPSKISGTAMNLSSTQTASGKTFIKPTLQGSIQNVIADSYNSTVNLDMSLSNDHVLTLTGNPTITVSNVSVGQYFALELIQDATGARTVTWFGTIHWENSFAPVLTITAAKKDKLVFKCTSLNNYDGYVAGQNIG